MPRYSVSEFVSGEGEQLFNWEHQRVPRKLYVSRTHCQSGERGEPGCVVSDDNPDRRCAHLDREVVYKALNVRRSGDNSAWGKQATNQRSESRGARQESCEQ